MNAVSEINRDDSCSFRPSLCFQANAGFPEVSVHINREEQFECSDPHVLAGVLKLWLRELREPLVPPQLYEQCTAVFADAERCVAFLDSLPPVQRASLTYLVRFLQLLALPSNAERSKMDSTNLATVIAPNVLRRPADASDSLATDPARALEDARSVANLCISYQI